MNVIRVLRALLRQNRWMLLLFALWPVAMALILLLPHGAPDPADLLSVLHQECFYALALVSVTAATLLGTEQRARRTVFVLARAVSRTEYLLAALTSVLLSSLVFTVYFIFCGFVLVTASGGNFVGVLAMGMLQLVLSLWFASVGILFSVFLPGVLASVAVSLAGGAVFLFGQHAALFGLSRLIPDMLAIPLNVSDPSAGISMTAAVSILVQAVCAFALAVGLFKRRDLDLKES